MYDIQRIGKLIADIENYRKELESYEIKSLSDIHDGKTFHASSMLVFAILNRVIDLGAEIISSEHLGAPNTYREILPILAKANVLNKEKAQEINELIKNRNVFAHMYDEISEHDLYNAIRSMGLIDDFVKIIKKRVSSK